MMKVIAILAAVMLSACAAQQMTPQSMGDELHREPTLEMNVPDPAVITFAEDGTCVRVLHGWRVISSSAEVVLERNDIGRITISNVGNSHGALMDLWVSHAEDQRDEYGDQMASPDCGGSSGCTVTYTRVAEDGTTSRVHAFQAGAQHVLELEYPTDSRNSQFAIADAVRTARQVGCPTAE